MCTESAPRKYFLDKAKQMRENAQWLRIMNPRCKDRWKFGTDLMCEASCGALLIAKHDLPEKKVKSGDLFVCCRSFQPQYGRGKVNIFSNSDKEIIRFIKRAWYL